MDHGRYGGMQQGWDANSAYEGYGAARQSDFRASGSYGSRRYQGEISPRDPSYARKAYQRGIIERDVHPVHVPGAWSQNRRRGFDDEYPPIREPRKHIDYRDLDDFHNQGNGSFHGIDRFHENPRNFDRYSETDRYRDYEIDRQYRRGPRDDSRSRETSRERDRDFGRRSYDSDYERGRKDGSSQRRESREFERDKRDVSRERDSTYRFHERSRSRGRDERSRSRSPRGWSRGRSQREESYEEDRYYDGDDRKFTSMTPSATVIVKGLSQNTNDEDLYQILAEWGPLQHIRVIKDRNSGISRGFAFIDFPTVEAASTMINSIGESGLVIDGRKLVFDYSSKPTSGPIAPTNQERTYGTGSAHNRFSAVPSDWMCTICGCVNFARRIYCFQCNESRTDDAPSADMGGSNSTSVGRRALETGPTHVLVVRGLDENTDEEMLRYEFSKHAPVKDVRLVRDKFTHVSRGFAFVHFHSVEDATKALEVTNGTALERNGQIIRVAYAKSVHGPGAAPQSSSLAAAAIEAAAFSQQYDSVGWAPKEYIPDENQSTVGSENNATVEAQKGDSAPQSGFVWDEKSGYYYDAASGFYYDGNTGLYYDGNNGVWYTYDQQTQQYVPCTDQSNTKTPNESSKEALKTSDNASTKKAVISAPAVTTKSSNGKTSLNDAVQAAAAAAMAAEKKEKERIKEIKLASKSSILANKKKMNNVLAMWNKRNHESQVASSDVAKTKPKSDAFTSKAPSILVDAQTTNNDPQGASRHMNSSSGGTIKGVIRNSGRGVMNSDLGSAVISSTDSINPAATAVETSSVTPFKTDSSALGSYSVPTISGSGKRRFSEAPVQSTSQTTYRDRAAERRSLYGSSSSNRDELVDLDESNYEHRKGSAADMPFPPGVGGGRSACDAQNYEVITADRAIDESNVGNRMLRNMGWQEGLGLGKDGGGIKEPVVANVVDDRSGLGSRQRKVVDPVLEAQAGDSYRTIIHKKAIARFREMS